MVLVSTAADTSVSLEGACRGGVVEERSMGSRLGESSRANTDDTSLRLRVTCCGGNAESAGGRRGRSFGEP